MVLINCEFFCFENEVWCRASDGTTCRLTESDIDTVRALHDKIEAFYPEAHRALAVIYKASSANIPYFRFRIVSRFLRCNFSNLDHVPDIAADGSFNFESVPCPIHGECRYHGVICRPTFDHKLSPAELRVMELLYRGLSDNDMAATLCLSPLTIKTHIRNALTRLGLHSRGEFMRYAAQNNLFSSHGKIQ